MDLLKCWFSGGGAAPASRSDQPACRAPTASRFDRRASSVLISRLLHLLARSVDGDPAAVSRTIEGLSSALQLDLDEPEACQNEFEQLFAVEIAGADPFDRFQNKLWREDLREAPRLCRPAQRSEARVSSEAETQSHENLASPDATNSSDSEVSVRLRPVTAVAEDDVARDHSYGTTLNDMPEPLLAHIFSFLDPSRFPQRLFTVGLVCRRWMDVALGPEFKLELVLDRLPLESPASVEFAELLRLCRRHAHQVRQVRFSVDRDSWLRAGHVSALLAALPRLEKLELGLSKFVDRALVVEHPRLRVLKILGDVFYAGLAEELEEWEVAFDVELRCPALRTFHRPAAPAPGGPLPRPPGARCPARRPSSEASLNFFALLPSLCALEYLHVDKYGLVSDEQLMRRLSAQNPELKLLTLQRKSPQTRFVLDFFPRYERVSLNHVGAAAADLILRSLDEHEREWHALHLHHDADEALVAAVIARPALRRVGDLRLSLRRVPVPAVAALAALRNVKSIWLYDSWQEGDKIATLLAALPSARTLCLCGPLGPGTLTATAEKRAGAAISKLRIRKSGGPALSGPAIRSLRAAFPALAALEIDKSGGGALDEDAWAALAEFAGPLRELAVHEEQLEPGRVRGLRAALPNCRIIVNSRPAALPCGGWNQAARPPGALSPLPGAPGAGTEPPTP